MRANPRVVYHGRIPWPEMRSFMEHNADLGLLLFHPTPALMNLTGEGSTKLFEYLAVGLPVLYSGFPKLRKFVETIGAGYPVDSTEPRKIAEAIDYLCGHPELCKELGENGRRAVVNRFCWEREEQKLLAVYRILLSGEKEAIGAIN